VDVIGKRGGTAEKFEKDRISIERKNKFIFSVKHNILFYYLNK